jgi:polyisoprenoid-binding protein YceI
MWAFSMAGSDSGGATVNYGFPRCGTPRIPSTMTLLKDSLSAGSFTHRREVVMSRADSAAVQIPGFIAGTWEIDPVHSEVSFLVRHLVVSKVRGRFDQFSGTIVTNEDLARSSVNVTIDAASVNTNEPNRDNHVRSADFLDVENFPNITFRSTAVRSEGGAYLVDGELTIRGVTRPVTLDVAVNGFTPDPYVGTRTGFSAATEINREDFGVSYNGPIPGAGNAMVLSDKVSLILEVEAVLQGDDPAA